MTRLISIVLPDHPPLRNLGLVTLSAPQGMLSGGYSPDGDKEVGNWWSVSIRGAAVFLVSPAGWRMGESSHQWDLTGERRYFEYPRSECRLSWSSDDPKALDKDVQRYDSPPMSRDRAEPMNVSAKDMGDA